MATTTTTTGERRYWGTVKTLSASPPSLVIIPDDRPARAGYDRAAGIPRAQLLAFLDYLSAGPGKMPVLRVSYVLRPGGPAGTLVAQDVRRVGAAAVMMKKKEEEVGASLWPAGGPGGVRIKEENNNDVSMIARARGLERAGRWLNIS